MRMRLIDAESLKELFPDNGEGSWTYNATVKAYIDAQPTIQPDDDRLERCRFEYINACKIVTYPTPDTRKKDIDDAYAVVRALNPIFGEEGF